MACWRAVSRLSGCGRWECELAAHCGPTAIPAAKNGPDSICWKLLPSRLASQMGPLPSPMYRWLLSTARAAAAGFPGTVSMVCGLLPSRLASWTDSPSLQYRLLLPTATPNEFVVVAILCALVPSRLASQMPAPVPNGDQYRWPPPTANPLKVP